MKIDHIRVGQSQTFNLGEYNSVKFTIELDATLDEDDDPEESTKLLRAACKESIRESASPFLRYIQLPTPGENGATRAAQVTETFLGSSVETD